MRVLVAVGAIDGLDAAEAGATIGRGWLRADPAAQLAVVPLAAAGESLVRAAAAIGGSEVSLLAAPGSRPLTMTTRFADGAAVLSRAHRTCPPAGLPEPSGTGDLGAAVADVLDRGDRPRSLVLDLAGEDGHDAGAGLLAALGARAGQGSLRQGWPGLAALAELDLTPVRERLAGVELVGLVSAEELDHLLLGLRGITSRRGRAEGVQTDTATLLAADDALARFGRLAGPEQAEQPGAGAAGGLGFAVLALGGRLSTGPCWLAEQTDLVASLSTADLVITGTEAFDFAHRGGPVVQQVATWAGAALRPCVVLAGSVQIGVREMRLMGVEGAHALEPGTGLEQLAARVARSWSSPTR